MGRPGAGRAASCLGLQMRLYRQFEPKKSSTPRTIRPHPVEDSAGDLRATGPRARTRPAARLDCRLGVRYGPTREEHLDIFPAGDGAPVHIFIHGGYWRRFNARDHDFLAPAFVEAGITFVSVNYALCPKVTMDEIVREVRAAVAWTHAHARGFGGDPARLTVSGHSAGGHLCAMALSTDWEGAYDLPADTLKGGVAVSGLFDLAPFPYTYLQPDAAAHLGPGGSQQPDPPCAGPGTAASVRRRRQGAGRVQAAGEGPSRRLAEQWPRGSLPRAG